jgi:hypothetical protein
MTNSLAPSSHFQDALTGLIEDWKGLDERFYHQRGTMTIEWYIRKVKSLLEFSADIRTKERTQFMEAACAGYGMKPRRMYEALAVYEKYAKPGDSVRETCERIFREAGGWSKALPPKKKTVEEPKCSRCPIHCNHEN